MALPVGWPPRPAEGRRSIRFFAEGTATALYEDTAYLFIDGIGANPYVPLPYVAPGSNTVVAVGTNLVGGTPWGTGQNIHDVNLNAPAGEQAVPKAMIWAGTIRVCNDAALGSGLDLYFSFDGLNDHGKVLPQEQVIYRIRYEAGIAFRGAGAAFRVEAW